MAQFDVYANPNPETRDDVPFLLDVQSDFLRDLGTRVVVPLLTPEAMGKAARHLNPRFQVKRKVVYMSTAELAGIALGNVGEKVATLEQMRGEIIAALDFLFTGF